MKYKIQSVTNIGNYRKSNQDNLGYFEKKDGSLFAIVCDGMGGHAFGEVASKIAVDSFLDFFKETDLTVLDDNGINKWLRESVKKIVMNMKEHSDIFLETRDMGTTLTAMVFVNEKAYVVNIGDSRTYKVAKGKVNQITRDQNLWNDTKNHESKKAELKRALGVKFNELTYWKVLTSALGPNKTLKVDTYLVKESKGTYILTTDGVHDYVDNDTLKEIIEGKGKLKAKANELVEYALNNLSTDNLSLIIVEIDGE